MATTTGDKQDLSEVLGTVLRRNGLSILEERSRLLQALRELAPADPRGVHLLMTAYDAGVPARLRETSESVSDFKIGQETAQVVDNFGTSQEAARAAVETWATVIARSGDIPAVVPRAEEAAASRDAEVAAQDSRPAPAPVTSPSGSPPPSAAPTEALQTTPEPVPAQAQAGALPAGNAGPPVVRPKPLPLPTAAPAAQTIPPMPGAGPGAAQVQPLPASTPGGTKPLPLPGTPAGGIKPLPLPGAVKPLPLPGSAPPPPASAPVKWAIILPVVFAIAGASLWASGIFNRPAPTRDAPQPGPQAGGGKTDEGYPIADVDKPAQFKTTRIDGQPNTLLFAFGLRSGGETYTYQAAVGFEGKKTTGVGLIKAVKRGQEASTGEMPVTRVTQADGYVGFTMAGKWKGNDIGAPAICVSALAGKKPDDFDVTDGGGGFCAFGTTATGICDGDTKLGCGDLVP